MMHMRKHLFYLFMAPALILASVPTAPAMAQEADTARWAVPVVSVTNLRQAGDYDAGMETQALLGMPMRVLKNDSWLKVQTPDDDVAYVLNSSVKRMTDAEMKAWNTAQQVVVTSLVAFVYEKPNTKSAHVSDVVAGNRLKMVAKSGKYYNVEYPDGRRGYIAATDAQPLDQWRRSVKHDAQSIIATGKTMIGAPYMWGGMSTKGMDCSGFVRTSFLLHDITLPRNAYQQAAVGQHIDIAPDFSNLQPGDLVFFGRRATDDKPAHVSHVGIYIGNKKFIHSLAWVHISSFNPADPEYDEYDLNRLLWAQRVLPYVNKAPEIMTNDNNSYYK